MNEIAKVFVKLAANSEAALIGYVMCGDPSPKHTTTIADALIKGGIDILELGLPFSDPIADGPTIQAASTRALKARTTPRIVLETVREIKKKHDIPVVVMTYYNPVFKMGLETFFDSAGSCGVDGVIVPDLPIEEAQDFRQAADTTCIDTIFLAAPSTTNERLAKILECSHGFLYLVSHFGVTGAKTTVENSTITLIKRVKSFAARRVPLAVGFGVSQPHHVKRIIEAGADGVIVGSAFVNVVADNLRNVKSASRELTLVARGLKEATLN